MISIMTLSIITHVCTACVLLETCYLEGMHIPDDRLVTLAFVPTLTYMFFVVYTISTFYY